MKKQYKTPQLLRLTSVFLFIGVLASNFILQSPAYAAGQILSRSLTLQANGLNGGSAPGVAVDHLFTFTLPTGGNIGSVKFEYCTTAADVGLATCQAPPSMNAAAATLGSSSGIADFQPITGATANVVVLTRATTNNVAANTVVTAQLQNVTNPQAKKIDNATNEPNYTFFVRISTYTSMDGTGTPVDKGSVTASTAEPIFLSGTMPEALLFCTGEAVPFKAATTIPDCANATSGTIEFNQLFDQIATATATSQMAASTNAGNGYVITVNGSTLMSGTTNAITALSSPAFPLTGASQFGLNLKANDATYFTAVGQEVSPLPSDSILNGVTYRGEAINGYDAMNTFKFVSGDAVADSGYILSGTPGPGGPPLGSDAQIYTVTYIANVPGSLPAGDYSTTLTYICTPTY